MQVFRTYLQSIEKNKIVFQYISQGHSSRINGRERSRSAAVEAAAEAASTVPMSGKNSSLYMPK